MGFSLRSLFSREELAAAQSGPAEGKSVLPSQAPFPDPTPPTATSLLEPYFSPNPMATTSLSPLETDLEPAMQTGGVASGLVPQISHNLFTARELLAVMPAHLTRRDLPAEMTVPLPIHVLEANLRQGRPSLMLSDILESCPQLFVRPLLANEDMEISLPYAKVRKLVELRSQRAETENAGAEAKSQEAKSLTRPLGGFRPNGQLTSPFAKIPSQTRPSENPFEVVDALPGSEPELEESVAGTANEVLVEAVPEVIEANAEVVGPAAEVAAEENNAVPAELPNPFASAKETAPAVPESITETPITPAEVNEAPSPFGVLPKPTSEPAETMQPAAATVVPISKEQEIDIAPALRGLAESDLGFDPARLPIRLKVELPGELLSGAENGATQIPLSAVVSALPARVRPAFERAKPDVLLNVTLNGDTSMVLPPSASVSVAGSDPKVALFNAVAEEDAARIPSPVARAGGMPNLPFLKPLVPEALTPDGSQAYVPGKPWELADKLAHGLADLGQSYRADQLQESPPMAKSGHVIRLGAQAEAEPITEEHTTIATNNTVNPFQLSPLTTSPSAEGQAATSPPAALERPVSGVPNLPFLPLATPLQGALASLHPQHQTAPVAVAAPTPATMPQPAPAAPAPVSATSPAPAAPAAAPEAPYLYAKQMALRAIFRVDRAISRQEMVELAAQQDGVSGAFYLQPDKITLASGAPTVQSEAIRQSLPAAYENLVGLAASLQLPLQNAITLKTDSGVRTFFVENGGCLVVTHSETTFRPGIRERLQILAQELCQPSQTGGA